MKIQLLTDLPILKKHGCLKGKQFEAKYTGENRRGRREDVEFIGKTGSRCVALGHEYKIIEL